VLESRREGIRGRAEARLGRNGIDVKRTAFKRRTPLARAPFKRRAKPMRQRARKPRRIVTPENRRRMAWVRTERCCAPPHICEGIVQAHHAGKNPGMRLKSPDDTVIPLCMKAHQDIDNHAGAFRGMSGEELREWQDQKIAIYQAKWAARQGVHVEAMAFE
jgi:hypothetical protein